MQTTYQQLEKIVLPHLSGYKTDLTNHDCKILQNYTGKFIYGYRPTGTDLLKFADSVKDYFKQSFINTLPKEKTPAIDKLWYEMYSLNIWITTNNKSFLYFDGMKFHPKTKEQVTQIWKDHCDEIRQKLFLLNEESETFIKIY